MTGLSLGEKQFIQGGIAQDLCSDGRKQLTYGPIYVETGVIPQGRGGEELSTELSVALQRCLLGGKSAAGAGIDLSSLIVVEGKVCWDPYIDGLVVSSDGNLIDALGASIKLHLSRAFCFVKHTLRWYALKLFSGIPSVATSGVEAALSNTGIPRVHVAAEESGEDQPDLDISDEEFLQFDTSGVPAVVTLTKVGRHCIVDATLEEESQMSSAVSVSINRKGLICGLT
ncbi:hypothetical protein EUGRSUZ_G01770 [Eucalyptus grandis]|uniref:Uncharacterized protein n=2 Tax=Eucalyptus grandis TaxID=71139 RepID=A0ACC3K3Y7_EUCGR|nr:hypothetical protein EUGRSUZ_G01770 [Eucalyptus grandis]